MMNDWRTFNYVGMSAYVVDDQTIGDKLSILSDAISLTHNYYADLEEVAEPEQFDHIVRSEEFIFLCENESMTDIDERFLPQNMHWIYKKPTITKEEIKGVNMVKIYIPAVATDKSKADTFVYKALVPVMEMLFGDNLLSVKTRESNEYELFEDAVEKVVLSVDRLKAKELVTA